MSKGRPIPDLREFLSTVLAWDFYKDVLDEADLQKEEEEKAWLRVKSKDLDSSEVEELILDTELLTPLQQQRKKKEVEMEKKRLEQLSPEEREEKQEERKTKAKHKLAQRLAREALANHAKEQGLQKVPHQFEDEVHYIASFMPLYFRECQAQIQRCKDSEMLKEAERVRFHAFRLEEPFVKLELLRTKEACTVTQYSGQDLVLLTQEEDLSKPHHVHLLGLVDHSVMQNVHLTVCVDMASKPGSRMKEVANLIAKEAPWYMVKVTSMSTQIREFEGMKALPEIFLKETILNREDVPGDEGTEMQAASALELGAAPKLRLDERTLVLPEAMEQWLQSRYNESQQNAIRDSQKVQGITLVQGPPGTGKTTTVMAIIAGLLGANRQASERKNGKEAHVEAVSEDCSEEDLEMRKRARLALLQARMPWLQPSFVPFTDQDWQEVSRRSRTPFSKEVKIKEVSKTAETEVPQKVLVCGPSNASIDEVLRRIDRDGIVDVRGERDRPFMLRMGPNCHPDVEEYSIKRMVDKRLKASCEMPDLTKREQEKDRLMKSAKLLFSTLSISGNREMVGFSEDFDSVVIDEASQGVELSTLVPLKLGCRRLILVGDPEQLPATCFSEIAKLHNYDRSLFQRLQQTQYKVNMLNTQYRMHPAISAFPSANFYNGNLLDFLDAEAYEKQFPTAWSKIPALGPVAFFNLKGTMEVEAKSFVNVEEADFIINFYRCLTRLYRGQDWQKKFAVISPYAQQVHLIRRKFMDLYNVNGVCPIDVNTVDGFQGREKDCVMVSLVRGAKERSRSVGFLKDRRRMNVAFTRARLNLWVVGNASVLSLNEDWKVFIDMQMNACRLLRATHDSDFLLRYVKKWNERNPQKETPEQEALQEVGEVGDDILEAEDSKLFTVSNEELQRLRQEEEFRRRYEKDREEASDQEPEVAEAEEDTDKKRKAEDAVGGEGLEEPEQKVAKTQEDGQEDDD